MQKHRAKLGVQILSDIFLFLTATAFSDTQQRRKTKCKLWKFVKLG